MGVSLLDLVLNSVGLESLSLAGVHDEGETLGRLPMFEKARLLSLLRLLLPSPRPSPRPSGPFILSLLHGAVQPPVILLRAPPPLPSLLLIMPHTSKMVLAFGMVNSTDRRAPSCLMTNIARPRCESTASNIRLGTCTLFRVIQGIKELCMLSTIILFHVSTPTLVRNRLQGPNFNFTLPGNTPPLLDNIGKYG